MNPVMMGQGHGLTQLPVRLKLGRQQSTMKKVDAPPRPTMAFPRPGVKMALLTGRMKMAA